jgi:hypothetical protein
VDRHQGVAGVVLFEEEGLELRLLEPAAEGLQALFELLVDVLALAGELEQDVDIVLGFGQGGKGLDLPLETLAALLEGLEALLVLPDVGGREPLGQNGEPGFFLIVVKENLGALRTWRSAPWPGLPGR